MSNFVRILVGDVREVLERLSDGAIDCSVSSPPYYNLRSYLDDNHPDKSKEIGLETTPAEYVADMVSVYRHVKRVLKDEGTIWVNIGDTYVNKNLQGIPFRTVFGLQDDGWLLRSDVIWNKINSLPENVTDRVVRSHEYFFMLSKQSKYYFDHEVIKEPSATPGSGKSWEDRKANGEPMRQGLLGAAACKAGGFATGETRNKRSVWNVPTEPFKGAHFAAFSKQLIEPCILSCCPIGGIVLDPFGGSGTTGVCATKNKRNALLCELNLDYLPIMIARLNKECPIGTKIVVEYPDRTEESKVGENKINDEFFDFD